MNSPFTEWLCLLHYSENLAIIKCPCVGVYIEILCFFHWSIYLHQDPQYLKYYKSIKVIDTFFCKPPGLVLLYVIFDKFCLLHVHTNFGISLVISKKKSWWDFDCDGTKSIDQLGRIGFLTVLHLATNICGKYLCLFRFSLITFVVRSMFKCDCKVFDFLKCYCLYKGTHWFCIYSIQWLYSVHLLIVIVYP